MYDRKKKSKRPYLTMLVSVLILLGCAGGPRVPAELPPIPSAVDAMADELAKTLDKIESGLAIARQAVEAACAAKPSACDNLRRAQATADQAMSAARVALNEYRSRRVDYAVVVEKFDSVVGALNELIAAVESAVK